MLKVESTGRCRSHKDCSDCVEIVAVGHYVISGVDFARF